jgi:NitT/TauT family transport system substrate-binding protein
MAEIIARLRDIWPLLAFLLGALSWPAQAEEIVVTLWGTGMYGAPYAVGMEKGYFKEAGIDLTNVAGGTGGGSVVRNVLASALPFGEVAVSAAIAAHKQGLPIIIVGAGARAFDNVWVAMPNSPISKIQDLIGKRVSYTNPKSISDLFVQMLLTKNGVDPAKVTRVSAGGYGPGLTLLENGGVDLAPVTEPLRTMTKNKYKPIFSAKDNIPPIMAAGPMVTRDLANKYPEKIRGLLLGRRRGVDFIYANPAEAGRIVAKAYKIPEAIAVEAVSAMAKAGQWSRGEIDLSEYNNMAEGMRLTGELTDEVAWKALIDTSFLPDDLKAKTSPEVRR